MAFQVLVIIVTFFDLDINQMDIKIVFLYSLINEFVSVDIPKGFKTEANQNMVCKLFKTLYSLKQSAQLWYKKLLTFLL